MWCLVKTEAVPAREAPTLANSPKFLCSLPLTLSRYVPRSSRPGLAPLSLLSLLRFPLKRLLGNKADNGKAAVMAA